MNKLLHIFMFPAIACMTSSCVVNAQLPGFTTPVKAAEEVVVESKAAVDAHHHLAVGLLAAAYHCKYKQWPSNLEKLKAFREEYNMPLQIKVDWDRLQAKDVAYSAANPMKLITTDKDKKGSFQVISVNSPPVCKPELITANFDIDLKNLDQPKK